MTITIPIRTISEANRSRNEHWAVTRERVKAQRAAVSLCWRLVDPGSRPSLPSVVTMTRIAPRALDDDNLARSFKAVRDQVAAEMGVDDRDPRVTWRYAQRRGRPNEYAVEISTVRTGADIIVEPVTP